MPVDHVLDLAEHASQAVGRQPALEHGELDALTVSLTDLRDPSETDGPDAVRLGDVVRDQDVHSSGHHKRRIGGKIASKVTGE